MSEGGQIKILVVLGTAREGRMSERVAKAVFDTLMARPDLKVTFADVKDYIFGETIDGGEDDSRLRPWKKMINDADGIFIVSPEYNHSYPGELKMLIDGAFEEYAGKPVAICGVSDGGFGGVRMIEQLRGLLAYLQMIPVMPNITVSKVDKTFTEDGETEDPKFYDKVNKAADAIIALAAVLRNKK